MIYLKQLPGITEGKFVQFAEDAVIKYLVTDSRKVNVLNGGIFFAIRGVRHDGHAYVRELFDRGVRNFIVESPVELPGEANIFQVSKTLGALQDIAAHHRAGFDIPVVGITGSNGKTIIKEWLYKLLSLSKNVVKSPRSYNSQLGVPLSAWQMNDDHDIGVFEAGISKVGEMEKLERVIMPTIGIFSNIGSAHDGGFASWQQKVLEKALLFKDSQVVVYCKDHELIDHALESKGFTWGYDEESDVKITGWDGSGIVELSYLGNTISFDLPFRDKPSFENTMHCITCLLYLGVEAGVIQAGLSRLSGIKMRLELKRGMHNCYLVDDSYNNDLAGLQTALDFLDHQTKNEKKSVILSDILEAGGDQERLYSQVAEMIQAANVHRFIGVGPAISRFKGKFPPRARFYPTIDELISQLGSLGLKDETILVKGARNFHFEILVKQLEEKIHGTVLEINLDALTQNLNFYRAQLSETTKLMVMVKAFAYGSGSFEVANLLQYHHVDYLGVAYADEGVALRQQGIRLPIMVMNPSPESFEKLRSYQLEPEVYSLSLLDQLLDFTGEDPMGIHIKLDTGMHRLGFDESTVILLIDRLKEHQNLEVKSIFSHLSGADDETHNAFSHQQATLFEKLSDTIKRQLSIAPLRHLLNSPGILRFPMYHFDMVRLGIGLYGLEANGERQNELETIGVLKTVVSQIKNVQEGDTIGYGRKGVAQTDAKIATIAIGYADGFSRSFSNGIGRVWVNGKHAPVIGNVCMDMTMIDVTGIEVNEGDEVEVFGPNLPIQELAHSIGTIPYEILTNVSQRVKRVYYSE